MTSPDWHAPAASGRLDATVTLPGSKSLTNRYLVLAALADDESLLRISAASPESREASRLTTGTKKRCSITNLLNSLGVSIPHTVRIPATPDGPLAVIADLSEYRSR